MPGDLYPAFHALHNRGSLAANRPAPAARRYLPPAESGAFNQLTPVPEDLLRPLTAERHGGQVILLPGGSRTSLDPELVPQECALHRPANGPVENPDLVASMAGELVRPEEGKFAALAGALSQNGVVLYIPKGVTIDSRLTVCCGGREVAWHMFRISLSGSMMALGDYVHEAASPDEVKPPCTPGLSRSKWVTEPA